MPWGGENRVDSTHPSAILPHHPDQTPPADCGMVPLTRQEAQRLLDYDSLISSRPAPTARNRWTFCQRWSDWRRHQARARWHHYRTRLALIA
jgi:hypothetical protein